MHEIIGKKKIPTTSTDLELPAIWVIVAKNFGADRLTSQVILSSQFFEAFWRPDYSISYILFKSKMNGDILI